MNECGGRLIRVVDGGVDAHGGSAVGVAAGAHQLYLFAHAFAVGAAVLVFVGDHAGAGGVAAFSGTGLSSHNASFGKTARWLPGGRPGSSVG